MMKPEEAIKSMHNLNMVLSITDSERESVNMAIEALEKQIPKKPEKEAEENMLCPLCGGFLGYELECREEAYQIPYCPGCGQAIDWSDC